MVEEVKPACKCNSRPGLGAEGRPSSNARPEPSLKRGHQNPNCLVAFSLRTMMGGGAVIRSSPTYLGLAF